MSDKSKILTSLLIFSSSLIVPVFGMETNKTIQPTAVIKKAPRGSKKYCSRVALQGKQTNNNLVIKGAAVVKSLSASFDKILNKKPQNSQQSSQKNQPQKRQQSQPQRQQKAQQQKSQKENVQSQTFQQQLPLQQKERKLWRKPQQSKQKQNNNIVQNCNSVIQDEQPKKSVQRQSRNKVKAAQNAAVIVATNTILQNERNKKMQQQIAHKVQNVQPVVRKGQNNIIRKQKEVELEIIHSKNEVCICDHSNNREIILFKKVKDILSPGTYYRTSNGLRLVPKALKSINGLYAVKNHLSNLTYAVELQGKMRMKGDIAHSFSTGVENECADLARVVVHNAIACPDQIKDDTKKFDCYATIPGVINKIAYDQSGKKVITQENQGVFEFTIRKTLYENEGVCFHRFHAPKGMVGVDEFGAKAQNKRLTS